VTRLDQTFGSIDGGQCPILDHCIQFVELGAARFDLPLLKNAFQISRLVSSILVSSSCSGKVPQVEAKTFLLPQEQVCRHLEDL
jgi:hypothetical protein